MSWALYYNDTLPPETFMPYDLLVFDDIKYPDLKKFKEAHKPVLGYVSIGEADLLRKYDVAYTPGLLIRENPNWGGSFYVDIANPIWKDFLIKKLIPSVLAKGFDGIMLDTIDNPLFLSWHEPRRFSHFYQESVNLVKSIRQAFPDIIIMLNRGFDHETGKSVLPDVAPYIDYLLIESASADQNPVTKKFIRQPKQHQENVHQIILDAKKVNPSLQALSLDYWDPKDKCGVADIYRLQRSHGYIPMVSTVMLEHFYPEPICSE